ncbi:hypothetical protein D3C84_1004630 [compost metagenome]
MYADLPLLFCGSELARDGGLTADLVFADVPNPCGSGLAREGGLPADRNLADVLDTCGSELARDSDLPADQVHHSRTNPANRPAGRPPRALLRCTPPREAEWRFCAVGNPAWMPG